jgi:hypothetical protein
MVTLSVIAKMSGFHMTLAETEAEFDRLNNAGLVDG